MSSQEMWTVSQYCLVPMVLMLFMALFPAGLEAALIDGKKGLGPASKASAQ